SSRRRPAFPRQPRRRRRGKEAEASISSGELEGGGEDKGGKSVSQVSSPGRTRCAPWRTRRKVPSVSWAIWLAGGSLQPQQIGGSARRAEVLRTDGTSRAHPCPAAGRGPEGKACPKPGR